MNKTNILSVDANAHLRKLTSNYYRAEVLNIIKLIRSSLRRNASTIKVSLSRKTIIIEDNGQGISPKQKSRLIRIADINISQLEKENEIMLFIKEFGIDLLLIFSFSPLDIKVENSYNTSKESMIITEKGVVFKKTSSIIKGTKIIIKRKSNNLNIEKKIISDYCRNIGNKIEINGRLLLKKPIIKDMIVSLKSNNNEISITKSGNLCKIWTLNYGIPFSLRTFPGLNGYIFEFAGSEQITDNNDLISSAKKLYTHLINKYQLYPPEIQQRIRELVFTHYNITKSTSLLKTLNCFKIFEKKNPVNISFLEDISRNKKLYCMLNSNDIKNINTDNKTILILEQFEIDLLINNLKMKIVFLQKNTNPITFRNSLFNKLFDKTKKFLSKKLINKNKEIELTNDEDAFIKKTEDLLSNDRYFMSLYLKAKKINIKMINQKLFTPSCIIQQNEKLNIFLFRKHKTINKALKLYKSDKNNLKWLLPQIFF